MGFSFPIPGHGFQFLAFFPFRYSIDVKIREKANNKNPIAGSFKSSYGIDNGRQQGDSLVRTGQALFGEQAGRKKIGQQHDDAQESDSQ